MQWKEWSLLVGVLVSFRDLTKKAICSDIPTSDSVAPGQADGPVGRQHSREESLRYFLAVWAKVAPWSSKAYLCFSHTS